MERPFTERGKIIKRVDSIKWQVIFYFTLSVVLFIIAYIFLAQYFELISRNYSRGFNFYGYSYGASTDEIRYYVALFCIICFLAIISFVIKAIALMKMFVCACEKGVYGLAGKVGNFMTQPFDVTYNQITNVKTKGRYLLILECGPNIYSCTVNNADTMRKIIENKINELDF